MTERKKDLFVAIDANAIVHRAFHAYPPTLTTSDGVGVNAVYGFTVMLLAMFKLFDPKYVFCAFDTKAPTFRHTKFADYKAKRKPTDESLLAQFPLVERVLDAFNIPVIKKEGYEADDILGTVSKWTKEGKWSSEIFDMYILTGDRDLLQLIEKNVYVCMPQGSFSNLAVYDEHKTLEKYGYLPSQVIDYKALVGDASDNIPGIKGIGEKTALTLLQKYGSFNEIAKNADEIGGRVAMLIREGMEQAEFSRDLATIDTNIDLHFKLEDCLLKDFDENELRDVFKQLEFKSLISKIPQSIESIKNGGGKEQLGMFSIEQKTDDYDWKNALEEASLWIKAYISKEESFDGTPWKSEIIVDKSGKVHSKEVLSFTEEVICETWYYNFEDLVSDTNEIVDKKALDIRLLAYNLSSGKKSYNISSLAFEFGSKSLPEKVSRINIFSTGEALVEIIDGIKEKMRNTVHTEYVKEKIGFLETKFKYNGDSFYEMIVRKLEMPVSKILGKMEGRGIKVDMEYLKTLDKRVQKLIDEEKEEIFKEIGHEFNVNSPKQLADVLYNEIGLPSSGKSRSTRESVLLDFADSHPAIAHIMKYRELAKISGTYIKPFLERHQDVVRTDFKQMGTSSGRFSSINPNMQNIPSRGEWANEIRKMFVPREGFVLVGADYSQIEFRIMADISMDEHLVNDFKNNKDIHLSTASRILDKPEKDITKEERNLGKTINFSILFGQSSFGLSKLAGIETSVASKYIEEYFRTYKGVAEYIQKARKEAMKFGYVQSMFGRTRHIAGLTSRNRNIVSAAVREAVNMPIQGGEADIMKLAMLDLDKMIEKEYKGDAFLLLQIHDELIFEVKKEAAKKFMKKVDDLMTNIIGLNVPLDVHVNVGNDMSELK